MESIRSRLLTLLTLLALVVGTTAVTATTAQADTTDLCFSTQCYRQDPAAMRCTGVETETGWYDSGQITLDLRYSAGCGAAWARLTQYSTDSMPFFIYNTNGELQGYAAPLGVTSWTNMVDDFGSGVHAEVCLGSSSDPNPHKLCSPMW